MAEPDKPPYTVLVGALLAPSDLTLSDDERTFYQSSITDQAAREEGANYESVNVLDDFLVVVTAALPAVKAGKVPGFGALRMQYTLELGKELADCVSEFDAAMASAAGTSTTKTTNLRGTRALRQTALRVLKNLAARDEAKQARLQEVASEEREKPDERSRSLTSIANEVENAIKTLPARVAADAGATMELVNALRTNSTAVLSARQDASGGRNTIASLYDKMNVLDGRIRYELLLLSRALRNARKSDPSVPSVRSKFDKRAKKKAKKAEQTKPPATDVKPPATDVKAPATEAEAQPDKPKGEGEGEG